MSWRWGGISSSAGQRDTAGLHSFRPGPGGNLTDWGFRGGPWQHSFCYSLRWGFASMAVGATIYQQHLLAGSLGRAPLCLREKAEPGVSWGTASCIMRYSLGQRGPGPSSRVGWRLWARAVGTPLRVPMAWREARFLGRRGGARSLLREAAVRRSPASREPHPPNACGITPAGGFSLQLRAPRCCSRACAVRSQARRLPRWAWRELSSTRRLNARLLDHNERHSLWRLPSANDFWRNQAS